ncbi:sorbosone dehydrogenase [Pedobacter sp. BS3]|uniref:PQQ-dependent sugar dehydrogenase n=1 Tax=Pedobacter sp. BS3 TaxID=2567937 RepID=UPI0011EEDC9F|nr:PQQ-dependent sugar dehydrogenase [Pedobacter sp. BS3]TZF82578.1 sorbosone dehydrogenase [Pedobacter sp. BS3]
MKKPVIFLLLTGISSTAFFGFCANHEQPKTAPAQTLPAPDQDNAGLKLPAGFSALKAADKLGKARHLAVTPQGDIYVKLARPVNNNGIIWLHDTDNDGRMDEQKGFGNYGGTGIYLKDGYLYASSNEEVFRYKLDNTNKVTDTDNPEKLVTGLISRRQHETKSIVLDNDNNIYVNIGAYKNSCQVQDRTQGSPGIPGCPLLDSAGGIWQFKANKQNQTYSDGVHYATGLRNVVGLDWNTQNNTLFVMQHGRDQLDMFPQYYDAKASADLPAECMYMIKKGDDAGWPYTYYDPFKKKIMQAPEYGGDGKKEGSNKYLKPVVAFPAHLAPNGLLFYTGSMFPEKYKHGAFIAFHGSWNRAPEPQAGYFVAFVPFKDGKPSGEWEIFADGFSGVSEVKSPRDAQHRPCGLAQGPDGSLYVTDDAKGTVYRIMYQGGK